jgi:outer membrane cobalamin receptor
MRPRIGFTLAAVMSLAGVGGCAHALKSADAAFEGDRSTRVVTAVTIEKSGAQTVWDALQRTIPFYVFHSNGWVEHRGRTSMWLPDQPVIVLDGTTLTDFTVLNNMPAADIWLIEVLDGPDATTYYGTNAGQGAIRIFTKTSES